MINFKSMLAYNQIVDPAELTYPVVCSIKEDGYRCSMVNKLPKTRSGKEIANKYTHRTLRELNLPCLDGELVLVNSKSFNSVQSAFSSHGGKPEFNYIVFDCFNSISKPYAERFKEASEWIKTNDTNGIVKLARNFVANSPEEVWELFHMALDNGDEGLIIRDPNGPYKFGRSTFKEGWMLKLKPRKDAEATIIAVNELMHNDDAGNSTKLENMVPGNTLGSFTCKMPCGTLFNIGTGKGLTKELRDQLWQQRDKLKGQQLTYTYHKLTEAGLPREPRIKGVRDLGDIS